MNYVYGYIRVSKKSQSLSRQKDLLKKYECNEILEEKYTGTKRDRPALNSLLGKLRPGDTVIVESFSRLGRSTKDLIDLVNTFKEKNVKFISIKENFDVSTPQGKLMMTLFQAISEFERDLIAERTMEGLESARARGRNGGRPKCNEKKVQSALTLYYSKNYTLKEIEELSGVSRSTIYRRAKEKSV